jgi:hypothetical protein
MGENGSPCSAVGLWLPLERDNSLCWLLPFPIAMEKTQPALLVSDHHEALAELLRRPASSASIRHSRLFYSKIPICFKSQPSPLVAPAFTLLLIFIVVFLSIYSSQSTGLVVTENKATDYRSGLNIALYLHGRSPF